MGDQSSEMECLRADLARVTAERDEARAELMRCTAECDEVRARGRELRREVEALTVERDALRSTLVGERAEIDRLGSVLAHVMAEREALRAAILDLEREDHSVHSEECDGREHVAGDSCGADGKGGWTCCETLSEEDCVAAERSRCSCGLVAWRDRMRSAADLARGLRGAEDWRARAMAAETERDALRAIVEGRTVAPTLAEARAVREAGGAFVRSPVYLDGFCGRFAEVVTGLARLGSESEDQRRALARWFVIDRGGRPCAWPVAEVSCG